MFLHLLLHFFNPLLAQVWPTIYIYKYLVKLGIMRNCLVDWNTRIFLDVYFGLMLGLRLVTLEQKC